MTDFAAATFAAAGAAVGELLLSLARTAAILTDRGQVPGQQPVITLPVDGPWEDRVYSSAIGPVRRLRFPLDIERNPLFWEHPAETAGASNPVWVTLA